MGPLPAPRVGSRGVFLIGRPFRAEDVLHPERLHVLVGRALDALHAEADALLAASPAGGKSLPAGPAPRDDGSNGNMSNENEARA